jgi:23S rRNA (guanosine2251-2'-O)-methyltransferase
MRRRKQSGSRPGGPGGRRPPARPDLPAGRREAKLEERRAAEGRLQPRREGAPADGRYWIYGQHAVLAALRNPRRKRARLLLTREAEAQFAAEVESARARLGDRLELVRAEREELAATLGRDAVHQGIAAEVMPLPSPALDEVLAAAGPQGTLLVLDQVTDPHNVGAILRSAAAFGAAALIVTQHHSAAETGSLAKAASGALEQVPLLRVANLVQALEGVKKAGFWCLGLAAEGTEPLDRANLDGRIAFVLGAEGTGLRRLTREHCDLLVRLPTKAGLVQLNVSNAAAIALYERARANSSAAGEPEGA